MNGAKHERIEGQAMTGAQIIGAAVWAVYMGGTIGAMLLACRRWDRERAAARAGRSEA